MSKESILYAAASIALRVGYRNVTRQAVATEARVGSGTVSYHFGTVAKLQDAVMRLAVTEGVTSIIAQGLADRHKIAQAAPQHLKNAAAKILASA